MASVRKLNLRKHKVRVLRFLYVIENQGWKLLDSEGRGRPVADHLWLKEQQHRRVIREIDYSAVLNMAISGRR